MNPPSSEAATILLEPEKAVMVGLLRDASILHFAGHGQSDTYDPLKSALLLRDWRETPFTIADLAGFQHVIGSLWEVSDSHCVGVARSVYAELARGGLGSDRAVVRGLRNGVWSVRQSKRQRDDVVSGAAGAAASTRDGHSVSDRAARRKLWYGGDPRVWAAYIHMGP
ncbi:hypothetical protein GGTG_08521 [Gaeumannomyces tritici R3-111a-1]|uniref:CHAT domain-containing protein n=1 Tax=Gaeumannomyces tritici (strain R3-111a-1) TaxID=644352 RepID=J3P4T5_GAET3|nr:hypothetical protein GGTG_08521 [Gaeumannomyces tritici R3-111a-1]EJT74683.1 hypothetical protein GGTG_08521 [Gaeumannomyces tritici R3-111a-1]